MVHSSKSDVWQILEASRELVRCRGDVASMDIDGRFRLELSPGAHELRIWYEGHQARRIQGLVVVAGAVQRVSVTLDPAFDRPTVLRAHAATFHADPAIWAFFTGKPDALQHFAEQLNQNGNS